ncbi:MAG: hypothetical protein F6J95_016220 [Leptolyngbya sp. SIO1E4]|nr:hypothetical protein [Leptolyngbya sp. SIO1E4]
MTSQRHIIQQQILDLHLDLHIQAKTQAFELQNQLSALYRSKIIPLIETFCDRLSDPDTLHRIDTLEIDLGEIDLNTLETDFVQKVAASLHKQLSQRLAFEATSETSSSRSLPSFPGFTPSSSPPSASSVNASPQPAKQHPTSPADAHFELLRDFLQTGRLPWWCESLDQPNLEKCFAQLLADAPEKLKDLLQNSLKQTKTLQRLVYQFSEPMLMDMLKLLVPTWHPLVHRYLQDVEILTPHVEPWRNTPPRQLKQIIWQGIWVQVSLNPTLQPRANTLLQSNLLHIATQLQIDARSLFQQLLTAIETLTKSGGKLTSELPQLLTLSSISNSSEASFRTELIRRLTKLLTALKYAATPQRASSLGPKIDGLLHQLKTLSLEASALEGLIAELETQAGTPAWPNMISELKTIMGTMASNGALRATAEVAVNFNTSQGSPQQISEAPSKDAVDIYIQNAGLILLWPFLNRFLETLGLVESGQFLTFQATHQAVLLLQYLVNVSVESLEHALQLNKLLCGMDLADPVPMTLVISDADKTECDALLAAVIQHWSALKNTSITGFRQAFLQRAGILRPHHGDWVLQVEHQTYDVLVEQLPWSIRVIKLPWMEQVLYTEW